MVCRVRLKTVADIVMTQLKCIKDIPIYVLFIKTLLLYCPLIRVHKSLCCWYSK